MKLAATTGSGLRQLAALCLLAGAVVGFAPPQTARTTQTAQAAPVAWSQILDQSEAWYGGAEAERIAGNVLLYQRSSGGWPKNIEMSARLTDAERAAIGKDKDLDDSTIDNEASYTQTALLARVFSAKGKTPFKVAALRGIDYLLDAQYPNGGWPQYYPRLKGYYRRITYNDGAMVGVLELLREVAQGRPAYRFVDEARRVRARRAVERGIECILRSQIVVDGRLTAWCAQHDEETLEPAEARSYEKISLSGSESVGIVRFLMGVERPDARVVEAVEAAVEWLDRVRIRGLRVAHKPDPSLAKGYDVIVVKDAQAPPVWARFYEIGSNRPIFCGRDGVIKSSLAEIEHERRTGYNWYTTAPGALLAGDYRAWRRKWSPDGDGGERGRRGN